MTGLSASPRCQAQPFSRATLLAVVCFLLPPSVCTAASLTTTLLQNNTLPATGGVLGLAVSTEQAYISGADAVVFRDTSTGSTLLASHAVWANQTAPRTSRGAVSFDSRGTVWLTRTEAAVLYEESLSATVDAAATPPTAALAADKSFEAAVDGAMGALRVPGFGTVAVAARPLSWSVLATADLAVLSNGTASSVASNAPTVGEATAALVADDAAQTVFAATTGLVVLTRVAATDTLVEAGGVELGADRGTVALAYSAAAKAVYALDGATLRVVSIADPAAPAVVGTFSPAVCTAGYTSLAVASVGGVEAVLLAGECGLAAVDVTTPASPTDAGHIAVHQGVAAVAAQGDVLHAVTTETSASPARYVQFQLLAAAAPGSGTTTQAAPLGGTPTAVATPTVAAAASGATATLTQGGAATPTLVSAASATAVVVAATSGTLTVASAGAASATVSEVPPAVSGCLYSKLNVALGALPTAGVCLTAAEEAANAPFVAAVPYSTTCVFEKQGYNCENATCAAKGDWTVNGGFGVACFATGAQCSYLVLFEAVCDAGTAGCAGVTPQFATRIWTDSLFADGANTLLEVFRNGREGTPLGATIAGDVCQTGYVLNTTATFLCSGKGGEATISSQLCYRGAPVPATPAPPSTPTATVAAAPVAGTATATVVPGPTATLVPPAATATLALPNAGASRTLTTPQSSPGGGTATVVVDATPAPAVTTPAPPAAAATPTATLPTNDTTDPTTETPETPRPAAAGPQGSDDSGPNVLWIVVGVICGLLLCCCLVYAAQRWRQKNQPLGNKLKRQDKQDLESHLEDPEDFINRHNEGLRQDALGGFAKGMRHNQPTRTWEDNMPYVSGEEKLITDGSQSESETSLMPGDRQTRFTSNILETTASTYKEQEMEYLRPSGTSDFAAEAAQPLLDKQGSSASIQPGGAGSTAASRDPLAADPFPPPDDLQTLPLITHSPTTAKKQGLDSAKAMI